MVPAVLETARLLAILPMLPKGQTMSEASKGKSLQEEFVSSQQGEAQLSSTVWIILFFILMFLSVVTNTIYVVSIVKRGKRISPIHVLLSSFFLINLVDYLLLVFEFYLGPDSNYPFSDLACAFYQFAVQGNPLLYIGAILLLVYQTYTSATQTQDTQTHSLQHLFCQFLIVIISTVFLCIPSILYSKVHTHSNASHHCVVDLSSSDEDQSYVDNALTGLFLLIFKAVLPFWLPLAMISVPIIRMIKMDKIVVDKQLDVTMAITVTVSFVVFHLPYFSVVFARHVLTIINLSTTSYNMWVMNVLQSFFLLISFFFHIFRPMVYLLLDQELEIQNKLCRSRYKQVPIYKV